MDEDLVGLCVVWERGEDVTNGGGRSVCALAGDRRHGNDSFFSDDANGNELKALFTPAKLWVHLREGSMVFCSFCE